MEELDLIERKTKVERSVCSCTTCANMCKKSPCIGTPYDIAKLILAGHVDKLSKMEWAAGKFWGYTEHIHMLQLNYDITGRCCMLTEDNLCSLHESGLKPTEGKLAHHAIKEYTAEQIPPILVAAIAWKQKDQQPFVMLISAIFIMHLQGIPYAPEMQLLHLLTTKYEIAVQSKKLHD